MGDNDSWGSHWTNATTFGHHKDGEPCKFPYNLPYKFKNRPGESTNLKGSPSLWCPKVVAFVQWDPELSLSTIKCECNAKLPIEPRYTFGPYDFKKSKKAVYRALFLTRHYNTKSQKSKKLPGKSKFHKVPHEHDAWNCKNGPAWASAAIITDKK